MKGIVDSAEFMGISAGFYENPAYTKFNSVNFRDNPENQKNILIILKLTVQMTCPHSDKCKKNPQSVTKG